MIMGFTFVALNDTYLALSTGLLSLLMLLLGLTAIRFWMVHRAVERAAIWFSLTGLLDILFGILLLTGNNTEQFISLTFGVWGLLMGFIQAIESMYVFLAIRITNPDGSSNLPTMLLHCLNVLIGGGMAFVLVLQPYGRASIQIAGVFPLGFGILLALLIRRLQQPTLRS